MIAVCLSIAKGVSADFCSRISSHKRCPPVASMPKSLVMLNLVMSSVPFVFPVSIKTWFNVTELLTVKTVRKTNDFKSWWKTWNMLQVVQLSHYIKFMGQSNNFHLIFIILMETRSFKVTMQVIKSVN